MRVQRLLLVAAGFALASGLWSAFLWQQLFVLRSGSAPFCALGGDGCAALWDGAFANAVHATTGLPVAAWGVVWSAAAFALALVARARAAHGAAEPWWSANCVLAAGGAVAVLGLVGASTAAGAFCGNCAIQYLLVAGHAGAVFAATGALRPAAFARGAGAAALGLAAAFALAFGPALATPRAGAELGAAPLATAATPGGDALEDLHRLIGRLPENQRQAFANARALYREAKPVRAGAPRALVGPADAPVRITTFTDSGCSHCARFHVALEALLANSPPGSIAVEQRMFPLDRSCNRHVQGAGREELCLAARVRVCLESDPRALELAGWLHEEATPLTQGSIFGVAERLAPRSYLEACVASGETAAKIRADADLGADAGLQGTPFLLVNGRPAPTYVPLLYALAVTGGDAEHPAFSMLPPPSEDLHAGHHH